MDRNIGATRVGEWLVSTVAVLVLLFECATYTKELFAYAFE